MDERLRLCKSSNGGCVDGGAEWVESTIIIPPSNSNTDDVDVTSSENVPGVLRVYWIPMIGALDDVIDTIIRHCTRQTRQRPPWAAGPEASPASALQPSSPQAKQILPMPGTYVNDNQATVHLSTPLVLPDFYIVADPR